MAGESMDDVDMHEPNADVISIARCRVLLGDQALALSDAEIDVIRQHAHTMAHVLIETLLGARRG